MMSDRLAAETEAGSLASRLRLAGAAAVCLAGLLLAFAIPLIARYFEPETLALGLAVAVVAGGALAILAADRQRRLDRIRAEERSFRDLYENISEGVFRSTLDGRMISANPSLVRLNGYETEEQLIRCCNDIATEWYVDPNRRAEIHQMLLESGRVSGVVSEIYRHNTRERIWIEESVRLVRDKKTGEPLYYDGTLREVTEMMRRLELQDRYNKIASLISGCLYQHRAHPDGSQSMPYASIGMLHMFGVHPDEVARDASVLAGVIHPDDLPHIAASLKQSRENLTIWQCEYRVCRPGHPERWVFAHSVPEREADGSTLWHGYILDISERKRSEAKVHELAYFDPLTKLPNRTMLREKLRQLLALGVEDARHAAVLFVDLDHFKVLNDTKGHHVGDLLLCEIGARIRSHVGPDDLVARLGGDEFVVLLDKLDSDAELASARVQAIGEHVLAAIDQPFQVDEHRFQTTASIGASVFRCGSLDVDEILKRADLAMYEAKAAGRGTLRFFHAALQVALEDRVALTSELRQAYVNDDLKLFYQPQVDRSGRCFGAEALLRWSHPVRGAIPPAEFIPLAERSGFMAAIDRWVLRSACATLKAWERDPLTRELRLAVNVRPQQLTRSGFADGVEEALKGAGADPHRLELELTEHVMLDDFVQVSAVMRRLKALGVGVSIDDFGTGYSSLSYLKRLPIDSLKIDRSFVRDIESDPSDREIVQTILNIARSLRVSVVAEGVETEMQALVLRQMGCPAFQGYLFAPPMPLEDFVAHLREHRAAGASAGPMARAIAS
jgi:diguanylate cyclase (GGDEF)-like protein/PAS domain S-box-containing protein